MMAANPLYIRDYKSEIPGVLDEDRLSWKFPLLSSRNAHGKTTEWRVYVRLIRAGNFIPIEDAYLSNARLDPDIVGYIKVDSGIEGGRIKKSEPTIVKVGKNIGKISETNVLCQALRDALSLHNKQMRKAVPADAQSRTERLPPMLAQIYKDQKDIPFDGAVRVQREYNGVRTIVTLDCDPQAIVAGSLDYKVIAYSRRKLLYPGFQYIKNELAPALLSYWLAGRRLYFDGEIYKHGVALQDISGAARKDADAGPCYDYMVYDCFVANEPALTYTERLSIIDDVFAEYNFAYTKQVETFDVESKTEIQAYYKKFIEDGYEGAMVRMDDSYRYSYNEYHCKQLLKIKETRDAEFEVVGWTTGDKGKAASAVMIICRTDEGRKFPCTPAMEILDRIALAGKMAIIEENSHTHFENHWLGKKIIVYFDEWSRDNVPQRARTKLEIRDLLL